MFAANRTPGPEERYRQLARRDDQRVAQGLYAGEAIEQMHEWSEAGLLDEFFVFLEEFGMMSVLEQMELPGVQRVMVPTIQFVLLYLRHPCSLGASR